MLSQIIAKSPDEGLSGVTIATEDYNNNQEGPYVYNSRYLAAAFGGMQYYYAGIISMDFIRDNENGNAYAFPKLTTKGEKLALAFQDVIKDTEYYRHYRKTEAPVPKTVLEEYGRVINLNLNGFYTCKEILKNRLFENEL